VDSVRPALSHIKLFPQLWSPPAVLGGFVGYCLAGSNITVAVVISCMVGGSLASLGILIRALPSSMVIAGGILATAALALAGLAFAGVTVHSSNNAGDDEKDRQSAREERLKALLRESEHRRRLDEVRHQAELAELRRQLSEARREVRSGR
jgi:hypothetical protein